MNTTHPVLKENAKRFKVERILEKSKVLRHNLNPYLVSLVMKEVKRAHSMDNETSDAVELYIRNHFDSL